MSNYYMQIQPNWDIALDNDENCWLDIYKRSLSTSANPLDKYHFVSSPTLHYNLTPHQFHEQIGANDTNHAIIIKESGKAWIKVCTTAKCNIESNITTKFHAPNRILNSSEHALTGTNSNPLPQLFSIDLSNNEKYLAISGANGYCTVIAVDSENISRRVDLVGHKMDVTKARFFPSSKVVLTGSLDFTLKIWDVLTGQCAATLQGHRGGVSDVCIIGKGRHVISCASDGAIHMWNCGTQEIISAWESDSKCPIHSITLAGNGHSIIGSEDTTLVIAGLDDGRSVGVDVRSNHVELEINGSGAILSTAFTESSGTPLLITGSENGTLSTWDLRHTNNPVHMVSRNDAAINRIVAPIPSEAIDTTNNSALCWTAHADGVCCEWAETIGGLDKHSAQLRELTQLTGPEYEPIRDITISNNNTHKFTVSRDGCIRSYKDTVVDSGEASTD